MTALRSIATGGVTDFEDGLESEGYAVLTMAHISFPQGAIGDGETNDTSSLSAWTAGGGILGLKNGDYYTPGSVAAFTRPTLILADNAKESGTYLPFITITTQDVEFGAMAPQSIFVRQNNAYRNDETVVQIQRIDTVDSGYTNPSALRVLATKSHSNDSTTWAINAILENYSTVSSAGDTAISATNRKYGTVNSFGGSFNNLDYNKYATTTAVTAIVGSEFNMRVVGLDHPAANYGYGMRRVIDVLANSNTLVAGWDTNDGTNYGDGEVGTGIAVHSGGITDGYFRYGIAIFEEAGNPNPITTGMEIKTTGAVGLSLAGVNTSAQINLDGNAANGILFNGAYTGLAMRLNSGQFIGWTDTGTVKTGFENSVTRWRIMLSGTERFGINTSTGDLYLNGTKVLGARETGWTADTGTAKKTANATYSGTASAGYVQAEMQAVMDALRDATQTIKAIKDAGITHGWIGT